MTTVNRGSSLAALLAVLCCCGLLGTGAATAATSSPHFSIQVLAAPTVLTRVGETSPEGLQSLNVIFTNVGGAPTTGPYVITDELPTGLEVSPSFGPSGSSRVGAIGGRAAPLTCSATGQVIVCEGSEEVSPDESVSLEVPLQVDPSAPSQVSNFVQIEGGGADKATLSVDVPVGSNLPPYGFINGRTGFNAAIGAEDGSKVELASAHPYGVSFTLGFPTFINNTVFPEIFDVAEPKTVNVKLPRGMYANPTAANTCTASQLESDLSTVEGPACPFDSQVGVAITTANFLGTSIYSQGLVKPIYNMEVPYGHPAELAFDAEAGVYVHLIGHLNSAGEYEITAETDNIPGKLQVAGSIINLWGYPTDPSHDSMRGEFSSDGIKGCIGSTKAEREAISKECSVAPQGTAFLTLPDSCAPSAPLVEGETASWAEPGTFVKRSVPLTGFDGTPVTLSGCGSIPFGPSIALTASSNQADSPIGAIFSLHQTQDQSYTGRSSANLRDAQVTLPVGLALNPSAANGLAACSTEQIGYLPAGTKARFSELPQTCPSASKIGTLVASTPLLDHPLAGGIYVMKPFENPFGSLLGIYLAIEDPRSGIVSKLAGKVSADSRTGQLTAFFAENPDLPIEDIALNFFPGDRAALKSPLACGKYSVVSSLIPWSAPEGVTAHPSAPLETTSPSPGSGSCPTSEAGAPFKPTLQAGAQLPRAGAYSPFVFRLTRNDGEAHLAGLQATLPRGLLGKLAGITYCSDMQIAAARAREAPNQGSVELASPSCPKSSEIGVVSAYAGAGNDPYLVSGKAYLAGPYKSAPLSMVAITPAVAGPFDLGDVVIRVALNVDPYSAQITAISDSLPTILSGIPLSLRSLTVNLNRPKFTLNPTSCSEKRITGSALSESGSTADLLNRFQVGRCGALAFKPDLKLSLSGPTKRTGHPAVRAVLTYPEKGAYANIARAQVSLPHAEFLDQANLDKVCTQPELKSQNCPKRSIYGSAKAWSPLLAKPLEGPIYLGVGFGDELPDLVAELNGQIRVLFKGRIDTTKQNGIRNTFEALPDAPVSRVVIKLKGGKQYGLLVNSENVCLKEQRAGVRFTAKNGRVSKGGVKIKNDCSAKH